ncbi:MAG: hypothetical protein JWM05_2873 [Acidimicrobiales bacterium]|nr:hypothetical protein [Acidimicrobiales bacterium]
MIGSFRRHWRIAVGVYLVAVLVAVGYYVGRPKPKTEKIFQATAKFVLPTVASNKQVASNQQAPPLQPAPNVPTVLTQNILAPALADTTIAQARKSAGLPADAAVTFKATLANDEGSVTLTTASRNKKLANKAIDGYANAFGEARKKAVVDDATKEQRGLNDRLKSLDTQRREKENQLRPMLSKLPPYVLVNTNGTKSNTNGSGSNNQSNVPALDLPSSLSQQGRLLANERNAIYSQQVRLESRYGSLAVELASSDPFAQMTNLTRAGRVNSKQTSPLIPVAGILGIGALLALAAALLADRFDHTIHTSPTASDLLGAPVLAAIPARRHFEDQFADPGRNPVRAGAYRGLAATSIATDRLPKALLLTSPSSSSQDGVALNYAAALAGLGLRVALVATTVEQAWFLEPFGHDADRATSLHDLLALAHSDSLGDSLDEHLATTGLQPNLFIVPPGDSADLDLPLDGLAPLVAAFEAAGFDIVLVAGPALLDDADATIFAWSIRNVMWTVETHQVTEADAQAAAAHLELTGGTAFGVTIVGEEI